MNTHLQDEGATLPPDYLESIELLCRMGIRQVPVLQGAKKPLYTNYGFGREGREHSSSSTSDAGRLVKDVERFARNGRVPNMAIPTGQRYYVDEGPDVRRRMYLNVVDVDAKHGGVAGFEDLCEVIGPPPITTEVTTQSGNGSRHLWVLTHRQWDNAVPASIAKGVEFKRALQIALTPPSRGYTFVASPAEVGIAQWPGLESHIGNLAAETDRKTVEKQRESKESSVPRVDVWGNVDQFLLAIASAKSGNRSSTLVKYGAKVAYATAAGHGLASPQAVEGALWNVCETNGLAADYPTEIERKIAHCVKWSDPAQNPRFGAPGGERSASSVIGRYSLERLSPARRAVFADLGRMARATPHEYSKRYGALKTGLSDWTVLDALKWLTAEGLIEQGPSLWNEGRRASHSYKLTKLGNAVLRQLGALS